MLTALFAYNNYLLTKQSYLQTHPPKLVATLITRSQSGGKWAYHLTARNDGETEAVNVQAVIQIYDPTRGDKGGFAGGPNTDIAAGRTDTLSADDDDPPNQQGPDSDGATVTVLLIYSDRESAERNPTISMHEERTDKFCGTMKDSVAILGSCDTFFREYLEKPGHRSTKRR